MLPSISVFSEAFAENHVPEMATSIERAALNEVRFREANEHIERRRSELGVEERAPYLCECEEEMCTVVVRLSPAEYREARATPRRFVLAVGHPFREGEIVAERGNYMIVEKEGESGRIAEGEIA
jgi:hypothetical protein